MFKRIISLLCTASMLTGMLFCNAYALTPVTAENNEVNTDVITIGKLLEELGINAESTTTIKAVVDTEAKQNAESSGINTNTQSNLVCADELILTSTDADGGISEEHVVLYDENDETVKLWVECPSSSTVQPQNSKYFQDVTTTVDVNYYVYGKNAYKYVITYGAEYSYSSDLSGSSIYLYKPTSMYVRASSYSSTTHSISYIDYGCRITGYDYKSTSSGWTRKGIDGYFEQEERVTSPVSGRTYTHSNTSSYYEEMGSNWIGVLRNNDFGKYLLTYTVVFDDGHEVANTSYIDK